MIFFHKCHGLVVEAFRFGVHQTPEWFWEALEKGDIRRPSSCPDIVGFIEKPDLVLGGACLHNEDWLVRSERFGMLAVVSQDNFVKNFEILPRLQLDVHDEEIERLKKENAELRQKAENNNACYISEAAWAERVGKYLIDFDRNGYSALSRCMMIYIPEEKYTALLEEYKALGHSLEG